MLMQQSTEYYRTPSRLQQQKISKARKTEQLREGDSRVLYTHYWATCGRPVKKISPVSPYSAPVHENGKVVETIATIMSSTNRDRINIHACLIQPVYSPFPSGLSCCVGHLDYRRMCFVGMWPAVEEKNQLFLLSK